MRKIFGPKSEKGREVRKNCIKRIFVIFYSASNRSIIIVIKYRRMGWTECATSKKWVRNACTIIVRRKEHKVPIQRCVFIKTDRILIT